MPEEHNLPNEFMFCFYWIEVGYATMKDRTMTLRVYEKDLIHMIDIGVAIDLIIESIKTQLIDIDSLVKPYLQGC